MTRIDRYILVLYFRVFLVCFSTLSGLLVVIQLFTNIDEFVAFGKQHGGFARGLIVYFGPQMMSIFDRMCGLITLLAIMFVIAWLHRTNELTALLAAGISKRRIITPLLGASIGLILISVILRETLIPHYSSILSKSPRELGGEIQESLKPTEDLEKGFILVGKQLHRGNKTILNPVFKFHGPVSTVTRQIEGFSAEYRTACEQHPAGYLVNQFATSEKLPNQQSIFFEGQPFLLFHSDHSWLSANQCFVPSGIDFEVMMGGRAKQYASTSELIWRVKKQPHYHGADVKVNVHARFVQPLLDFTQILVGIPLILSSLNRNLVRMIASCIVSFAIFYGVSIGLRTLGAHETLLTASAGAWAPLLVFGPVAWAQSMKAMDS